MSERIEELLEDILIAVQGIRDDVMMLKINSELYGDQQSVVSALGSLGDRLTGSVVDGVGSDLEDVVNALSSLESAIDAK